jgi:ABC-2 type transport system permease protein
MNVVAFWTLETFAVQLMIRWASDLLGGQIIPLAFFAGLLGTIVERLPFASIYSTPLRIYIGDLPPAQWPAAIAVQFGWLALFAICGAIVWRAAQTRVVSQGG